MANGSMEQVSRETTRQIARYVYITVNKSVSDSLFFLTDPDLDPGDKGKK